MTSQNQNHNSGLKVTHQSSSNLSDLTKAGLIMQIVVSALTILGVVISIIVFALYKSFIITDPNLTPSDIEGIRLGINLSIAILISITLPGSIASVVLSSLALKKPTDGLTLAAGIIGIIFGWFIAGILILVGRTQK